MRELIDERVGPVGPAPLGDHSGVDFAVQPPGGAIGGVVHLVPVRRADDEYVDIPRGGTGLAEEARCP